VPKSRLFNAVCACLQEQVDGNNVDRFHFLASHYSLGDLTLFTARTESDQIRVMVSFWLHQITSRRGQCPSTVIGLLQHKRLEDFIPAFRLHLIPIIQELDLPVQTAPIAKEKYAHG
jgi:hypothetical protein